MRKNLLVVGKIPPPIGGVTIHVRRLLDSMDADKFDYAFIDLNKGNLLNIVGKFFKFNTVFLHTSNSFIRLFLTIISKISGARLLFTFHGNLGRYKGFRNRVDELAIKWAAVPILINQRSFDKGKNLNANAKLIPAFIPPLHIKPLPKNISQHLEDFVSASDSILCCTNAYNISFDVNNEEIYCGSDLMKTFESLPEHQLIFSDPSGNYKKYFESNGIAIPQNVLMITEPHDFIQIIKMSKIFIRATLTDGDSLSVKEGLYFDKKVVCSDCVDRPKGVILFKNKDYKDLREKLINIENYISEKSEIINGYDLIKKILER